MSITETLVNEIRYQLGLEPVRIIVVIFAAVGIYLAFMVLVKIFGSRVLTSMTASDAVIVIMFGSVAGRVIVGNPPTLMAGIIGLTTLMTLEAAFGTIREYIGWSRYLDRAPILLMRDGTTDPALLRRAHMTEHDINSAVRKAGLARREDVHLMILEPTGQISVIKAGQPYDPEVFRNIVGLDPRI